MGWFQQIHEYWWVLVAAPVAALVLRFVLRPPLASIVGWTVQVMLALAAAAVAAFAGLSILSMVEAGWNVAFILFFVPVLVLALAIFAFGRLLRWAVTGR